MPANDITIRRATVRDCDTILHHRRFMFEDMKEGTPVQLDETIKVTRPWLMTALANGGYQGGWPKPKQDGWLPALASSFCPGWQARQTRKIGGP